MVNVLKSLGNVLHAASHWGPAATAILSAAGVELPHEVKESVMVAQSIDAAATSLQEVGGAVTLPTITIHENGHTFTIDVVMKRAA